MKTEYVKCMACVVLAIAFVLPSMSLILFFGNDIGVGDVNVNRNVVLDETFVDSEEQDVVRSEVYEPYSSRASVVEYEPHVDVPEIRQKFWEIVDGEFKHSGYPINYLRDDSWLPINTTLVDVDNSTFGGEYVAVCNRNIYNIMFKDNVSLDSYVQILSEVDFNGTKYNASVDIGYERAYYYNKSTGDIQYVPNGTGELSVDYGNIASYQIYDNITERYIVDSDGIKHYYIVDYIDRDDPVWWGSNVEFVIPFTLTYNPVEFELQFDESTITSSREVGNVSIVNSVTGERVYVISNIRVFDDETSLDIGHYYVDYYPGMVTISTNVSISEIYNIKEQFVIDPIWVVEYTATGKLSGTIDNYDLGENEFNIPSMKYVEKRIETNPDLGPRLSKYLELPRKSNESYPYVLDNFNYGYTSGNSLVEGWGGWNKVRIGNLGGGSTAGSVKLVDSVSGKAIRYTHNSDMVAYTEYEFTRSVGVNSRDINYSIDFNYTMPEYETGSVVEQYVSLSLVPDGPVSTTPRVSINVRRDYSTTNPNFNFSEMSLWDDGGERYVKHNLTRDDWYTVTFSNFSWSEKISEYRGYQRIDYDFSLYNSTGLLLLERVSWDCLNWDYMEVYGFKGFSVNYRGLSGNSSRTSSFEIDDLRVFKVDVYDDYACAITNGTRDMMSIADYDLLYRYDVFIMYLDYNIHYRRNLMNSLLFVYYMDEYSNWIRVPGIDLPGNDDGFSIIDISIDYYDERDENYSHYSGVIIVDLSTLPISSIVDGAYKNLRFLFYTDVPSGNDYGIFIRGWNLWYVRGFISSYSTSDSMTLFDITGVYPISDIYYPSSSYANIRFNMINSLFGSNEPLAGSRLYYIRSNVSPSVDNSSWQQITSNLYTASPLHTLGWTPFCDNYDFIPTKNYRGYKGNVLWNEYMWFVYDDSIPEGDNYWIKVETINAGFTVVNIQVSDSTISVIHNRAPVVNVGSSLIVTGKEPVIFNPLLEGTHDDGGNFNILSYTYNIYGVDYTRVIQQDTPEVSFILPDDGEYFMIVSVVDSRGVSSSAILNITNLNAHPTLYIRRQSQSVDDESIPLEKLAVGDLAKINLEQTYDEDGYIVLYTVDFGDSTIETYSSQGPGIYPYISHVYTKSGVYTANVTATDDDGVSSTVSIIFDISNEVVQGYSGNRIDAIVRSEGIPLVVRVNEIDNGSRYNSLAKYLFKDTSSFIIEKNSLYMDGLDDRDAEESLEIEIDVNYMGMDTDWKLGKIFGSDVLVYSVTNDAVKMISRDYKDGINGTSADGVISLSVDGEFDKLIVIVNPSIWFKVKSVFGSRSIVDFIDVDMDAIVGIRNIDVIGFDEDVLADFESILKDW